MPGKRARVWSPDASRAAVVAELAILEHRIADEFDRIGPPLMREAEETRDLGEMQAHLARLSKDTLDAWCAFEARMTVLQAAALSVVIMIASPQKIGEAQAFMREYEARLGVARRMTVAIATSASSVTTEKR